MVNHLWPWAPPVWSDRSCADTACMGKAKPESRFGFGQAVGSLGAVVVATSLTQPVLRLDLGAAFKAALTGAQLTPREANDILFVGSRVPKEQVASSPQVAELARSLGIESSGFEQQQIAGIVVLVLAVIALIAIVRSVVASDGVGRAGQRAVPRARRIRLADRRGPPAAVVFAPEPREAMRPDLGLWGAGGRGAAAAARRADARQQPSSPFLDDFDEGAGPSNFDNTEHLAYSHGAWVPRSASRAETRALSAAGALPPASS